MGVPIQTIPTVEERTLQVILASPAFQRAHALRRLLDYLYEHRDAPPGEYAIALDALGKRPDFDPKIDASVRVHVGRLRLKLKEFFETEGRHLAVQFLIPAGTYRLEIHVSPQDPVPTVTQPRPPKLLPIALAACAILACTTAWLALRPAPSAPPQTELPAFWKRVLGNGKMNHIVIPSPVFFQKGHLRVRDVTINDYEAAAHSESLQKVTGTHGELAPNQSYSVASDSLAMATLTRLLTAGGLPSTTGITRDLSLELFGSENLIFLGIPPTSRHVEQLLARTRFYLKPNTQTVAVRQPAVGDRPDFSSPRLKYGIVSILPGQAPGTRLVLLSGSNTAALAAFLTSPVTLRQLGDFLRSHGDPDYFEVIVESDVDGAKLLKASVVAFHAIPATLWKDSVTAR